MLWRAAKPDYSGQAAPPLTRTLLQAAPSCSQEQELASSRGCNPCWENHPLDNFSDNPRPQALLNPWTSQTQACQSHQAIYVFLEEKQTLLPESPLINELERLRDYIDICNFSFYENIVRRSGKMQRLKNAKVEQSLWQQSVEEQISTFLPTPL